MAFKTYKGKFNPLNPEKYIGDPTNIIYRSGWEFHLMRYLDKHPHVIKWASEEVIIPYRSPIDGKIHRYFPDFYVEQINRDRKKQKILIEVKPKYQTMPPAVQNTKKNKPTKRYLNEVKTWGVNKAKWDAAEEYCKDKGWTFQIMHEDHLGIK
jgi:hypothetical protein|tara:strand:- start:59 stop:517 length:459 start_codon:yes stop_codon:yes gene_type:complete